MTLEALVAATAGTHGTHPARDAAIRALVDLKADPGLAAILAAWPKLPDAMKAGIVAMVKAADTSTP